MDDMKIEDVNHNQISRKISLLLLRLYAISNCFIDALLNYRNQN